MNEGSFDLLFNGFSSSSESQTLESEFCNVLIDVEVPEGKLAVLTNIAVAGVTQVNENGFSSVSVTYGGETESEMYRSTQSYAVTVVSGSSFSICGQDVTFDVDVGIFSFDSFINAFSGSGAITFIDC